MEIYQKRKKILIEELSKIEQRDGLITPQAVVQSAVDEMSPLHKFFLWDEAQAAYNFRLSQARDLINYVRVEINGKDLEKYHSVSVQIGDVVTKGYVSTEKVATNEEFKNQILRMALSELDYWQRKYDDISELKGVVDSKKVAEARARLEQAQREFEQAQQSA